MFDVQSNFNHYNPTKAFYTNDCIADFFQLLVGHTVQDIAMRMEAYCILGVEGLSLQSCPL